MGGGTVASVVLVHGIGTVGERTDFSEWLGALCAGAPALVRDSLQQQAVAVDYGDWSWAKTHGAQGPDDPNLSALPPKTALAMEQLARAWLEAAAASHDPKVATEAAKQLAELSPNGRTGTQGPMAGVRSAIAALSKVPLFGPGIYSQVQKVNRTNLWQVTAYVNNIEGAKDSILERFGQVIGPDTRIVIAHSLGTVVAYEAIGRFGLDLDLFLTTGSPLGLDRVIFPKLIPPASFPPGVKRWVNVADHDDFVAADPCLTDRFPDPSGQRGIEDIQVRNNGPFVRHHDITEYLSHDDVRAVVWDALDD